MNLRRAVPVVAIPASCALAAIVLLGLALPFYYSFRVVSLLLPGAALLAVLLASRKPRLRTAAAVFLITSAALFLILAIFCSDMVRHSRHGKLSLAVVAVVLIGAVAASFLPTLRKAIVSCLLGCTVISCAAVWMVVGPPWDTGWGEPASWHIRRAWGARVRPEALGARLRVGASPRQTLAAMGISGRLVDRLLVPLFYGMSWERSLDAMGVSRDLLCSTRDRGRFEYYVWCYPMCSTLGCCDGAVLLRFADGRLDAVRVYDPCPADERFWSDDVARHDRGEQPWEVRFSASKTLEAILVSRRGWQTILGPGPALSPPLKGSMLREKGGS